MNTILKYLTVSYPKSDASKKLSLLKVAEESIALLGSKLYGSSNWQKAPCGIPPWAYNSATADVLKGVASCGDKITNAPNCPIVD